MVVSADKRQRTLLRANQILVRKPGRCQLHSIIGPERMLIGQLLRRANDSGTHVQDIEPVLDIVLERAQNLRMLL